MRETIGIVLIRSVRFHLGALSVLAALLMTAAAPAQTAPPSPPAAAVQAGLPLSPQLARKIEVMIRNRSGVTPDYDVAISVPTASEVPNYAQVTVTFTAPGSQPKSLPFFVSTDGKTLAQFNKFDMGDSDLRHAISDAGRPSRGGDEHAPVLIVGFDDLECPFCARMNAELFPAVLDRYKDQVRVVYRDFPLPADQHPWALHAAVDANCLAAGSPAAYWSYVDYVHAHSGEMAGDAKDLDGSKKQLDKIAIDEGARQGVNQPELVACVLKQDTHNVDASVLKGEADPLRIGSTPTLFINGERIEGVVPIETIYRVIDRALVAEGRTPPPAVALPKTGQPAPDASPAQPAATPAQTKSGS